MWAPGHWECEANETINSFEQIYNRDTCSQMPDQTQACNLIYLIYIPAQNRILQTKPQVTSSVKYFIIVRFLMF